MKIRTDFVTNSSSSSFVAINLSSNILSAYLKENDISDVFERITWPYEEEVMQAELELSFAQSLYNILEKYSDDLDFLGDDGGIDFDAVEPLMEFIQKNKDTIDEEISGEIEMRSAMGEDAFAYFQRLIYADHHAKLQKWPCTDGWESGYQNIQEFNMKNMNGEVEEIAQYAYNAIWDLIWDDAAIEEIVEMTGVIEEKDIL